MNAFQEATSEKHLPIRTCAVCAQLTSDELSRLVLETDKMLEVLKDTSGKLIVDKCGKIGRQYRICNTCDGSLKCGNCPKVAIFNRFDVGCNHNMPAYLKSLAEVVKVIWVGKEQPSYKDLKPFLEVRKKVVWQALIGLKRDNPVYANVKIDEELLESWDETFIPPAIINSMMTINDTEGDSEE